MLRRVSAVLVIFGICMIGGWLGGRTYNAIKFDNQIGNHLELAATTSNLELAQQQLGAGITNIEKRGMVNGFTSVAWQSPDENVRYWYTNLLTAKAQLDMLPASATPAEKALVLLKLKETLYLQGYGVIVPAGISVYPYNVTWATFGWLGLLWAIGFAILFAVLPEPLESYQERYGYA